MTPVNVMSRACKGDDLDLHPSLSYLARSRRAPEGADIPIIPFRFASRMFCIDQICCWLPRVGCESDVRGP